MSNFPLPSTTRLRLGMLTMLSLVATLTAQTYEQVAPKTLAPAPAPTMNPLPGVESPGRLSPGQPLVPVLRGLVFLADRGRFQRDGVGTAGLHTEGIALLETAEFRELVARYLDRPFSLEEMNGLTRDVVLYFRRHGRPVVDVLVPEQQVASGTVQVLVVEGRLGEVRVEGNRWFTDRQIASAVRAPVGEVIEGGPLLNDLLWINRNPFRQVDLVFERGKQPGETDVILRTRDRRPLRVYTGYEDSGNALTGYDRVLAGVNWGNAFGLDQQLNYQFSASPDFRKLVAHSGSYIVPVPRWRHALTVFGSYAQSEPELAGGLFSLKGRSWQLSGRYSMPITGASAWTRKLTAGIDFKRSNNDLSFGGMSVYAQETDVLQATAAYHADRSDRHGTTALGLTVALSPGGLTPGNRTAAYQGARSLARADYVSARLDLERLTKLPAGFFWLARGTAQLASANLLGSEQLGLGGAGGPRGYEEREVNGDNGFLLVNELHAPPVRLANRFGHDDITDRFDFLAFFDYGVAASHDRLPDEPKRLALASVGVGFRYNLAGNVSVRADYGWQLKGSGVSDGRRESRGHLSILLAY